MWNLLPLSVRQIIRSSVFKSKIIDYIWKELVRVDLMSQADLYENEVSDSED